MEGNEKGEFKEVIFDYDDLLEKGGLDPDEFWAMYGYMEVE